MLSKVLDVSMEILQEFYNHTKIMKSQQPWSNRLSSQESLIFTKISRSQEYVMRKQTLNLINL